MVNTGIENRDSILAEARKLSSSSPEREFQHKVEIVVLALKGIPLKELEEKGVVSRPTLKLWLKSIAEEGTIEALRNAPTIGRPRKLEREELEGLSDAMNKSPAGYGYRKWDGRAIQDYISKNYNKEICLRHCQRIKQELIKSGRVIIVKE